MNPLLDWHNFPLSQDNGSSKVVEDCEVEQDALVPDTSERPRASLLGPGGGGGAIDDVALCSIPLTSNSRLGISEPPFTVELTGWEEAPLTVSKISVK